jgi:short-subunit dehydrogenase
MTPLVALVTSASFGIGHPSATLLAQSGFPVFGTSRNPDIRVAHRAHNSKRLARGIRASASMSASTLTCEFPSPRSSTTSNRERAQNHRSHDFTGTIRHG